MAQLTTAEARAQRLGWPWGVCGYSPNENEYWVDPAMGWANALLNPAHFGLSPQLAARELGRLLALPVLWNENMAPRYPDGTFLAGHRVRVGSLVQVGWVLCFWLPGAARDCPEWARVVGVEPDCIRLACDNGQRPYRLAWTPADARCVGRVYRATHYVRLPYNA